MMVEILSPILFIILAMLPVVLIAFDIKFMTKARKKPIFEILAFLTGGIYMIFAYAIWELPDYTQPLNYYGFANAHAPINTDYIGSVIIFILWSFVSYFILKFSKKHFSPIVESVLIAGVYIGAIIAIAWIVQLICGPRPQPIDNSLIMNGDKDGTTPIYLHMSDILEIVCLCIVPFFYIIHCINLMLLIVKDKADFQREIVYNNSFLNNINSFLCKGSNTFRVAAIFMLPVLIVLTIILILFGQQPDSIILAFTKTSDWILSGEIAPPPVAYDTHYLCTVSLRGHKKVVKPTRYGIRWGEKIVVNRQLCVANAFEQLIQERTPKFHRAIRDFYDKYGYPISRHIKSAWAADVIYIIMKPLEWIFVFVLYLFDERPENRICSQYLPRE